MRPLGLSLVLLAGCSVDNPVFMLTDVGEVDPGTTAATATTGRPPTTTDPTSVGPETTAGPGSSVSGATETTAVSTTSDTTTAIGETTNPGETTQLAEPGTTTLDPDSGSSDPSTTTSGESGEPMFCSMQESPGPTRDVFDLVAMQKYPCQPPFQKFTGAGRMKAGSLQFTPGIGCDNIPFEQKLEFGKGYNGAPDQEFCGDLSVYWGPNCTIGALYVKTTLDEIAYKLYYSPTDAGMFPSMPEIDLPGSCGCPDLGQNCCEYIPGDHALLVDGTKIPAGGVAYVPSQNMTYTNYRTHMPIDCVDDLDVKIETSWFAHLKL